MPIKKRDVFLAVFTVVSIILVFFLPPIPQDDDYHHFADTRTMWEIPHFLNVVSNIPFLLIGALGLRVLTQIKHKPYPAPIYFMLFVGTIFTGLGSMYYHLRPSNQTLIWDRLPMTIIFMSVFSAIISQYSTKRTGVLLLGPLLILGIGSVLYWHVGELSGEGDLRPYAFVQFYPMVAILLIIFLYPSQNSSRKGWLWVIAYYALAKIVELADEPLYELGGIVSGHTLKHVFAAVAVLQILRMLQSKNG